MSIDFWLIFLDMVIFTYSSKSTSYGNFLISVNINLIVLEFGMASSAKQELDIAQPQLLF